MSEVSKHFVTFYSPGTFVAEDTSKPIDAWDVPTAIAMAKEIRERYSAVPYAFQFSTRTREDADLDSKETATSPMYFLGGKVRTLAEVQADNLPDERILRSNMEGNHYERIITTTRGWRWTQPLKATDVVLPDEVVA